MRFSGDRGNKTYESGELDEREHHSEYARDESDSNGHETIYFALTFVGVNSDWLGKSL